jgi:ATF/CREB family transcription factor
MFPEPSPNSQALFNQLGGAATPGTIDFQRTALNAAAAQKRQIAHSQPNVTSQPAELTNGMDVKAPVAGPFDQHDANDAANGLFLLAQAQTNRNGGQVAGQYAMPPQMPVHAHPQPMMQMGGQQPGQSPTMANDATGNGDRRVSGMSVQSDDTDQANRPNTRGKGKRPAGNQANQAGNRRKAEEPAAKAPAGKKAKANNGHAMEPEPPSEDEQDMSKEEYNHPNGKKMTDEEKRKNFLERNR